MDISFYQLTLNDFKKSDITSNQNNFLYFLIYFDNFEVFSYCLKNQPYIDIIKNKNYIHECFPLFIDNPKYLNLFLEEQLIQPDYFNSEVFIASFIFQKRDGSNLHLLPSNISIQALGNVSIKNASFPYLSHAIDNGFKADHICPNNLACFLSDYSPLSNDISKSKTFQLLSSLPDFVQILNISHPIGTALWHKLLNEPFTLIQDEYNKQFFNLFFQTNSFLLLFNQNDIHSSFFIKNMPIFEQNIISAIVDENLQLSQNTLINIEKNYPQSFKNIQTAFTFNDLSKTPSSKNIKANTIKRKI